jgi:hypothetical protein
MWTWDDTLDDADDEVPLRAKAAVAAHNKDINSLSVSPNDGLVCSGSEVSLYHASFLEVKYSFICLTSLNHYIFIIFF